MPFPHRPAHANVAMAEGFDPMGQVSDKGDGDVGHAPEKAGRMTPEGLASLRGGRRAYSGAEGD